MEWSCSDAELSSSWTRKPLYRRCGSGERSAATEVARAAVDGVVGGEGRSRWRGWWRGGNFRRRFLAFLPGRTWSAPYFITFLTLLVSSPPRVSIPSLLIQTRAQHFGRYARLLLFWLREAPSRGGTLARHSSSRSETLARPFSSRSVKSSGGVF